MTPRQIEVFRAVMVSGSVTAAADRLHVSQPSISKQVQLLEDAVGFPLFERTGNRLRPTNEAEMLFARVQALYTGLDQIDHFATSIRENRAGEMTIAAMPLLAQFWLPAIVAKFAGRADKAALSLPVRSTDWIYRAIAAGRVDIGLCIADQNADGVDVRPLMQVPLACVVRPAHRIAQKDVVVPQDLMRESLILLRSFDSYGADIPQFPEIERQSPARINVFTTAAACEIVAYGYGVAVVDAVSAFAFERQGLIARPLRHGFQFDLALVTAQRQPLSRLASAMCDELLAHASQTQARLEAWYGGANAA